VWEARIQPAGSGLRYRILEDAAELDFRGLFERLEQDSRFVRWYSETLAEVAMEAFFWEHPPLTESSFDEAAELVLIESASLARLRADPQPFREQFAGDPESEVVVFPNLGGDAVLIVPAPLSAPEAYTHLAAFLRAAPERQIEALWRATARAVRENLDARPRWLSTAGMGVPWLHVRLDTRPKYYRFAPYKALPDAAIAAD